MSKRTAIVVSMLVAVATITLTLLFQYLQTGEELYAPRRVKNAQDRRATAVTSEIPQIAADRQHQFETPFERSTSYPPFDFSSTLSASLREAALGSAEAQYRAAVLLRQCRSAHLSTAEIDNLKLRGMQEDFLKLMKDRARRCRDVVGLPTDVTVASKQLLEAALQQGYPIAVAQHLIITRQSLPANEIDDQLLEALSVAGDDSLLRSEAYFLVLAAMDKRASASRMEPDPVVRNAWTLLQCRESWECDLNATKEFLRGELPTPSLNAAIDLAVEMEDAIRDGELTKLRMY